jgi:enamine deaminase RidA (YjgF/YER057c/UK114 family)
MTMHETVNDAEVMLPAGTWPRPLAPSWTEAVVGEATATLRAMGKMQLFMAQGREFALFAAVWPGYRRLARAACTRAAQAVYGALAAELRTSATPHAVRFWNHIPGIHDALDEGHNRYMAFNAGRYAAFVEWMGGPERFGQSVATASGIGDHGEDLVVHALGAAQAGLAVRNPRQTQPFEYSKRYGACPPCFARATLLGRRFFIGGTASICGEASVCVGDVMGQLGETLTNIEALLAEASRQSPACFAPSGIEHLRTYYVRPKDRTALEAALGERFPQAELEWSSVPLCRGDLLVEIEAVARAEGAA